MFYFVFASRISSFSLCLVRVKYLLWIKTAVSALLTVNHSIQLISLSPMMPHQPLPVLSVSTQGVYLPLTIDFWPLIFAMCKLLMISNCAILNYDTCGCELWLYGSVLGEDLYGGHDWGNDVIFLFCCYMVFD